MSTSLATLLPLPPWPPEMVICIFASACSGSSGLNKNILHFKQMNNECKIIQVFTPRSFRSLIIVLLWLPLSSHLCCSPLVLLSGLLSLRYFFLSLKRNSRTSVNKLHWNLPSQQKPLLAANDNSCLACWPKLNLIVCGFKNKNFSIT